MGFQTVFMVLNDHIHELETDPNVGRKMLEAAMMTQRGYKPVDFSIGCGMNAGIALPSQHADYIQVVVAGGNYARPLGYGGNWQNMDNDEAILRRLADELGYRIVKKTSR